MSKFWLLILIGLCATGCKTTLSNCPDSAKLLDWHPSIVNYDWDDSYWNTAEGQQNINYKSSEWCAILEAKLYVIFYELMAQLDGKEGAKLAAEQKKWLEETLQNAIEAGKQFDGGTAQSMAINVSFGHATQERIKILETQLTQQLNKHSK